VNRAYISAGSLIARGAVVRILIDPFGGWGQSSRPPSSRSPDS